VIVDVDKLHVFAKNSMSVADLVLLTVRTLADTYSSSLAVRRSVLEANAHLLKELPTSIDLFICAGSLRAGPHVLHRRKANAIQGARGELVL